MYHHVTVRQVSCSVRRYLSPLSDAWSKSLFFATLHFLFGTRDYQANCFRTERRTLSNHVVKSREFTSGVVPV